MEEEEEEPLACAAAKPSGRECVGEAGWACGLWSMLAREG